MFHTVVAQESLGYFVGRAAVVAVALALIAGGAKGIRAGLKWLRRMILEDMAHAIREVTAVDIAALSQSVGEMREEFAVMRDENSAQHQAMRDRIDRLEEHREM